MKVQTKSQSAVDLMQQTNQIVEEQAATIEEFAKSGQNLTTIAEELKVLIDRF